MSVTRRTRKSLIAAAVLGIGMSSMSTGAMAVVFKDFTVDEGSVPGAVANTFSADKITGNYSEVITFGAGTFDVSLKWNAGQFLTNDGNDLVNSQLGGITSNQYGLYALYQGSGTFSSSGGIYTFTTTPGVGGLSVYIDPNSDTTFTAPATGNLGFGTGSTGDDYLIATGTPKAGSGTLDPGCAGGINCGSFGTNTTFALTSTVPGGDTYFTFPSPFYDLSFQSGQFNSFAVTGTQTINGSMDVVFVPEPETLALLGLGLVGIGLTLRRQSQKA